MQSGRQSRLTYFHRRGPALASRRRRRRNHSTAPDSAVDAAAHPATSISPVVSRLDGWPCDRPHLESAERESWEPLTVNYWIIRGARSHETSAALRSNGVARILSSLAAC